ncbi:hypothetical protein F5Y07DRAFT_366382 [Xylaria sp. FL0933]|nr:hypothetical protein F5Y07DRAFT_366382 [Xylaria sp. FL0933]
MHREMQTTGTRPRPPMFPTSRLASAGTGILPSSTHCSSISILRLVQVALWLRHQVIHVRLSYIVFLFLCTCLCLRACVLRVSSVSVLVRGTTPEVLHDVIVSWLRISVLSLTTYLPPWVHIFFSTYKTIYLSTVSPWHCFCWYLFFRQSNASSCSSHISIQLATQVSKLARYPSQLDDCERERERKKM